MAKQDRVLATSKLDRAQLQAVTAFYYSGLLRLVAPDITRT
jgi:hypothetical protein